MISPSLYKNWEEIFETVYNGVVMVDKDGVIVICNQSGCELLGWPKENIIGKHIQDLVPDSVLHQVAQDGVSRPNMRRRIRDRLVLANQSPIYKDGKIIGAISVFQDITELKDILSQLDEKEKEVLQLKEILELLYDGIVIVNQEGIITMISQNYCHFLGVKKEQVVGKHITEVIEHSRMHIVAKTGQSEIGSIMTYKNKEIIVMRTPIRKNDEIVGAVGKVMFTDIRELQTMAQRLNVVENKLSFYKKELKKVRGAKYSFNQIVGDHERMTEAKDLAKRVANSRSTVLITGESGTGKELFAHAIHEASSRSEGPLVRVNCAAIPANILESELFGYEEGAFTGARKGGKPGKIEQAQGGTLFLDEIGDMPLQMQIKLLRVLQEKEIERLGGTETSQIDIRVIAATNRPLEKMIEKGEFRADLYYRLHVFHIVIPPLRERGEDIITTAHFLLGKLSNELGVSISGFHPEVESLFNRYAWPGNVRELQNVIERSLHLVGKQGIICLEHLPPYMLELADGLKEGSSYLLEKEVEKAEIMAIKRALKKAEGQRALAAEMLGIHRASLHRKIRKYGLLESN